MRAIKVQRLGSVYEGMHIVSVDDDEYAAGTIIPADHYDEAEQDWQVVRGVKGHADIGQVLCEAYDGSREWVRVNWDGLVWVLVEDGEPVVAERDE